MDQSVIPGLFFRQNKLLPLPYLILFGQSELFSDFGPDSLLDGFALRNDNFHFSHRLLTL